MMLLSKLRKKVITLLVTLALPTLFFAQQPNTFSGIVTDSSNGDPVFCAIISVTGKGTLAKSDFDGLFAISGIKPGRYEFTIESPFYNTYKGFIQLIKGETLKVALQPRTTALSEIVVTARANRSSENALTVAARKAIIPMQVIGSRELSRKGISNAEGAVSQLAGVSKQEGVKNIFVRGLGDRYNSTILNGFPLPSEDPEYKNIALSLFPSDVIQNVSVTKMMSSRNSGDVGGATIAISSNELENDRSFSVESSVGFNSSSFQKGFLRQRGSNYLGISKATYPKTVDTYSFAEAINPRKESFLMDHDYGISGGKKFFVNNIPVSFFLLGKYDKGFSQTNELIRESIDNGTVFADMQGRKSTIDSHQVLYGNLATNGANMFLAYNLLLIHNTTEYVGDYIGFNADKYQGGYNESGKGAYRRQQTNENMLLTQQLISNTKFTNKLKVNLGVSYSYLLGKEPDRRLNHFIFMRNPASYGILGGEGTQQRFFSSLRQHDVSGKVEAIYSLKNSFEGDNSQIAVGYHIRYNHDNYLSNRFSFTRLRNAELFSLNDINLDAIYNIQSFEQGNFDINQFSDKYNTNRWVHAGFVDVVYSFTPAIIVNAGLRFDYANQKLSYEVNQLAPGESSINKYFCLPFLTLKASINDEVLRLGLSKTYTLPHTKECAPYEYVGNSFTSVGNANLKPSDNYNADLRWEHYFGPSEFVAITTFYKYIHQPILRIYEGNAAGYLTYKNLTEGDNKPGKAQVAGAEFELKKELIKLNQHSLRVGANASFIYSRLFLTAVGNKEDRYTQLEGASPFIANFDITYRASFNDNNSLQAAVVLNYFSDRIFTIGTAGFQNTIEKGVPTLNAVITATLAQNWQLKLKAMNLLNPSYTLVRKNYDGSNVVFLNKINKGQQFSLGVSYSF